MGRGSDILIGLDLGTKKIAVAVAERTADGSGEARIIAVGQSASRGLRKGMIVNLEQAVSSVSDAIADAESMLSNVKISAAVVAFSSPELKCRMLHGMVSLGRSPRSIMPEDLDRVIETALSTLQLPPNCCVMHSIPIKYAVDGNEGIENPLDMTGMRLEVDLTALYTPTSVVQNVINCVEKAGIKVSGLLLKPLAESLGTLSRDEREVGASLVSIGGGTTSVSVFSEGHLLYAGEIPVGGDHITNDVSYILKIPFATAEDIKKGIDVTPGLQEDETGTISIENRGRRQELDRAEIREIIESRLDELFAESVIPTLKEIQSAGFSTEIVLAGGVMLTKGIAGFAESYLKTPVRVGVPVLYREMQPGRNDCRYGAVSGIIVYLLEKRRNPFAYIDVPMTAFKGAVSAGRSSSPRIKPPKRPSQSFFKTLSRSVEELFKELF